MARLAAFERAHKLSVRQIIESLFESQIRFSLELFQVLLDEIEAHDTEFKIVREPAEERRFFLIFELIE